MADTRITQLGEMTTVTGDDLVVVVDGTTATTKKVQVTNLLPDGTVSTAKLADGGITPAKLVAGSGTSWVWQNWSPTITGFTPAPTGGIYRYCQIGKLVTLELAMPNAGTSSATGFTISLPVAANATTNATWCGSGQVMDNGSVSAQPGLLYIPAGATTMSVFLNWGGAAWTASGNKRLVFGSITYEAA